jgi:hypothetical protein
MVPQTPEYLQPRSLFDEWKECVCGARVQRGLTVRGKPAYFEEIVDEETGELVVINHWVTCKMPEAARALYGARNDGTRDGKCPWCHGGAIVYTSGGATCASCRWTSVPEPPPSSRRPRGYRRRHPSSRSRMRRA